MTRFAVFLATLGGLGRIRWAPGTWGSVVGLLGGIATLHWYYWPWWVMLVILAIKFVICALLCTVAEREIGIHDAPAIILDEVWAMAAIVIVAPWIATNCAAPVWLIAAFVLFRFFDILKPLPLNWLAQLPSGWGIMADDLGAAVYTLIVLWVIAGPIVFGR